MNMRIVKPPLAVPHRRGKVVKQPDYLKALHVLPCVLSLQYGVEAAHVSFANPDLGHYGRGKGTKVHDRWALPLSPDWHRTQHIMNEERFWETQAPGANPHQLALVIHGLWSEYGDDFAPYAEAVIRAEYHRRRT